MRAQLGLGVRGVGVGVAGGGEDGAALDAGVEALFSEGEAFEGFQGVFFGCAALHLLTIYPGYLYLLEGMLEDRRTK